MRYLGIDYGKKKIGLALSEGQISSPYKVLEIKNLADGVSKVTQVINSEGIERVVVGVPESGEAKGMVKKFVKELKGVREVKVEIIEAPETLSSYDAKQLMRDLSLPKKEREKEDAYSASIILQNFLNSLD